MLTGKAKAIAMADKVLAIGGEGDSPAAGRRLTITLGPNDREAKPGSTLPVLPWKACAKIEANVPEQKETDAS